MSERTENSIFTIEKLDKHYLNQVIKVSSINKSWQYIYPSYDVMIMVLYIYKRPLKIHNPV